MARSSVSTAQYLARYLCVALLMWPFIRAFADEQGFQVAITGAAAFNGFVGGQSNREIQKLKQNTAGALVYEPSSYTFGGPGFTLDSTKLGFEASDKVDFAGFHQWMVTLMLSGDRSAKTTYIVPQAYISLFSHYATLYLGNYSGVEALMGFSGGTLLGGTGGFSGSAHRGFVNMTTGCYAKTDLIGDPDDATKITLMTPRVWGVQLGVSYTPDTSKVGRKNRNDPKPLSSSDAYYNRHFFSGGINYQGFLSALAKLNLSVTGVTGQPQSAQLDNNNAPVEFYRTKGVAMGGVLTFDWFSIGGECAWMGDSASIRGNADVQPPGAEMLTYYANTAGAFSFWNVSFSMLFQDKIKFAGGYYSSTRKTGFISTAGEVYKATSHIVNASLTYQFREGLQTYIEGFYHLLKNPAAAYEVSHTLQRMKDIKAYDVIRNQRAVTGLIGIKISF